MKKALAVAGIGAALIASGSLLGAGGTSADSSYPFSGPKGDADAGAFWVDVNPILSGWTVAKDRTLGHMICSKLGEGESEGALVAEIAEGDSASVSGIKYVIHAAEWHFCPSYY